MVFPVVVLFLWTRRGAWCLVSGEEDRRSWRGSLVSGEIRRLMKREWSLFLERKEDREERCLGGSRRLFNPSGRSLHLEKGIGNKVSGFVLRSSWSMEETTEGEPV